MSIDFERLQNVVLFDIKTERKRQDVKWGIQRHPITYWLSILLEEVGEAAQAMQKDSVSYKDTDADDLYTELIQVAAVAAAMAEQVKEERDVKRRD